MKRTILVFGLGMMLSAASADAATLSLSGLGAPVLTGSSFTIDVTIAGVTDLASYQFDVGYNPNVVSGVSVTEGPFLPTAADTLFIPGVFDDMSGIVSFTGGTIVGMGPGASGSGVLARLHFSAIAAGTADFVLVSPLLYDSVPNPIDLTTSGTSVVVEQATTAIPEPSTFLLLGVGLLLATARHRMR